MIGGNIQGLIQVSTTEKNEIGEAVKSWADVQTITGWLDLSSGDSKYTVYSAKVQESTHVFVADYVQLDSRITAENSRMVIGGKRYDVMLIDDPMEMHKQLEIYLKYTGGQ
nr:MAG TPA: head tail adaptor [Caudoviricetes sp.]